MFYIDQLSRYFRHIANLHLKVMGRELQDLYLNKYFDTLLIIVRSDPPLTQKHLAELMYINKSHLVAIVNFLFENKFINVQQNSQDRRENFISLTSKGLHAVSAIKTAEYKIQNTMLEGISKDKIGYFFEVLSILESKLKQMDENFQ